MDQAPQTNYIQTLMHVFKGHTGAGLFAMGAAIKGAGLWVGWIFTPIVPLIVLHAYYIVLSVTDALWDKVEGASIDLNAEQLADKKYSLQNYCNVVERVFEMANVKRLRKYAKLMRMVIIVLTYFMHLGFCCIYLVFAATNFKQILDPVYSFSVRVLLAIITIPMYFASLITSLKFLSVVSGFGNICLLLGCAVTYFYICRDLSYRDDVNYVPVDVLQLPIYICITIFACAAITSVLPFRMEMKHPEDYSKYLGVLNVAFFFLIILLYSMGIMSYYAYGSEVKESVTLNLPDNWLGTTTKVVVTLSVLFTYPINIYIPVSIIWYDLEEKWGPFNHPLLIITIFRSVLVVFTLLCALTIPFLELFISLVGAFSSATLTFVIPPILDLLINLDPSKSTTRKALIWTRDIFLLVVGVSIFIIGTGTSIRNIVVAFQKMGLDEPKI